MGNYKIKQGEIFGVVDLGSYSIKVMIASWDEEDKLQVLAIEEYPSEGIEKGFITNMEKATRSIKEAITKAQKTPNVEVRKVIVVFSEGDVSYDIKKDIITFHRGTEHEVKEEDVIRLWKKALDIAIPENEALIHLLPISYDIDSRSGIQDPIGMPTSRLEGNFIMIKSSKNSAKNIIKCIERAGYIPVDLIIQGIASGFHLTSPGEKKAGIAVVQIGEDLTSLAVYKDGRLIHYSELPIGGKSITIDIQTVCELTNRADQAKVRFGVAYPQLLQTERIIEVLDIPGQPPRKISQQELSEVIYYRLAELLDYVMYELQENELLNQIIAGVVITGGQARIMGMKEVAEERTLSNVRIGKPSMRDISGLVMKADDPAFSSIVGAAFYHFQSKWDSQFLLKNKKKTKKNNRKKNGGLFSGLSKFFTENFGDIIE